MGCEGLRRRYGTERMLDTERTADEDVFEVQVDIAELANGDISVVVTVEDVTTPVYDPVWESFVVSDRD
jgi:YbbR domain-containing protein